MTSAETPGEGALRQLIERGHPVGEVNHERVQLMLRAAKNAATSEAQRGYMAGVLVCMIQHRERWDGDTSLATMAAVADALMEPERED